MIIIALRGRRFSNTDRAQMPRATRVLRLGVATSLLLTCCWPGRCDEPGNVLATSARVWTDSSGTYRVEATLAAVDRGQVTLRRKDGREIAIPLERLSSEDRAYLESHAPDKATRVQFIDRFDNPDVTKNLFGSKAGVRAETPSTVEMMWTADEHIGAEGGALMLTYDKKATGGQDGSGGSCKYVSGLPVFDASAYRNLTFSIKGAQGGEDFRVGFSANFQTMWTEDISNYVPAKRITPQWQEATVSLDLASFPDKMAAIVIDFRADSYFTNGRRQGTVYIDDLVFVGQPPARPKSTSLPGSVTPEPELIQVPHVLIPAGPGASQTPAEVDLRYRTWTATTGHKRQADFVRYRDNSVALKLPDGKVTFVPFDKLSPADQDYVRRMSAAPPTYDDFVIARILAKGEKVVDQGFLLNADKTIEARPSSGQDKQTQHIPLREVRMIVLDWVKIRQTLRQKLQADSVTGVIPGQGAADFGDLLTTSYTPARAAIAVWGGEKPFVATATSVRQLVLQLSDRESGDVTVREVRIPFADGDSLEGKVYRLDLVRDFEGLTQILWSHHEPALAAEFLSRRGERRAVKHLLAASFSPLCREAATAAIRDLTGLATADPRSVRYWWVQNMRHTPEAESVRDVPLIPRRVIGALRAAAAEGNQEISKLIGEISAQLPEALADSTPAGR